VAAIYIGSSPVEVITYALLSLGAAVGMALMTYGLIEQPALRLFKWKGTQKVARRAPGSRRIKSGASSSGISAAAPQGRPESRPAPAPAPVQPNFEALNGTR